MRARTRECDELKTRHPHREAVEGAKEKHQLNLISYA